MFSISFHLRLEISFLHLEIKKEMTTRVHSQIDDLSTWSVVFPGIEWKSIV